MRICSRCKYNGIGVYIDEHHVTYARPLVKVYLCRPCHIGITVLNSIYAYKLRKKMSNSQRRRLFDLFMKSKWRMEQEDNPMWKLQRRVTMKDLPKLQKMVLKKET